MYHIIISKKVKWVVAGLALAVALVVINSFGFFNDKQKVAVDNSMEIPLGDSFAAPNFFKISSASLTTQLSTRDFFFGSGTASSSAGTEFAVDVGNQIINFNGQNYRFPSGVGFNGQQLTTDGGSPFGTLTWGAAASIGSNSLNFDEFQNPLVLDANISVTSGSFTWDWNGTHLLDIGQASISRNFSFFGELKPDDALCSNGQILKRTGANDWDCAADNSGTPASNSLNFDEFQNPLVLDTNITTTSASFNWDFGGANLATIGSASFTRGFKIANTTGDNLFRITNAGTVNAGLWQGTAVTDTYVADAISIIGGTIGANSISGTQTTTGTTTFGDNGDNIVFDSNTWDITGAGAGSGFTQFTVDNLDLNGNSFTSTTGGITIAPNSSLTNFTGSASLSANFEVLGYASASFFQGSAFGAIDCNDNGEGLQWSTATNTFTCRAWADADIPDTISLIGGTIGANNISGTQTTTGTLTFGDNGDAIVIDASNWDIDTNGKVAFNAVASHSFGGSIEPITDGLGSLGTTAKTWGQVVGELIHAVTTFIAGNLKIIANTLSSTTGGITIAPNSSLTNITGAASISTNFEASGYASASKYFTSDLESASLTSNQFGIDNGGFGQLVYRASGSEQVLTGETTHSFSLASVSFGAFASRSLEVGLFRGKTIKRIRCQVSTATSVVINFSANGTTDMDQITCGTSLTSDDGSIANATITKGSNFVLERRGVVGQADFLTITWTETQTRE